MWHHLAISILNDLLTGSWITRLLSTALVVCSLFSLGYLGGSSVQTLLTITQPAPSPTKISGSASERWNGKSMEPRETWEHGKSNWPSLRQGYETLSTQATDGK